MADKIVKIYGDARVLPRHDTLENWQTKNPILLEAEPSYVIDGEDGKKIKFGDGVTPWNDLPYFPSSVEVDQTYTPTSPNAQSGLATAEAVGVANDYTDKAIKSSKTYANNTFALAIKNTVSGGVLAVHDVSPVEHDLDIKLSSDTLTDFSNVGVSRLGKNLFDNNKLSEWGLTLTDSKYTGSVDSLSEKTLFSNFAENKRYTVSLRGYNNTAGITTLLLSVYYKDGTNAAVIRLDSNEEKAYSFTTEADKSVDYMNFAFYQGDTITLSYVQIEEGTIATDYKPYIGAECTPNADGTVEGLTSLSPDMTVMTDTEGVVIDMTYNADTKMYIDNKIAEISAAIVNNS